MGLHPYTQALSDFYTQSAQKRTHTRRRSWPEFSHIVEYIATLHKSELKILEVGCGDGRLYGYLQSQFPDIRFIYYGVDVSQGLIDIAQTSYPDAKRYCEEMISFIEQIPQQSFDVVIGIASIQHLPTNFNQQLFFHEAYRILEYEGSLIMTNWSFSAWFLKRYWRNILLSTIKSILTLGLYSFRSIMVPFTDGEVTHYRFYHMFAHARLDRMLKLAGFALVVSAYSTTNGNLSQFRWNSRNHFHIARKQVRLA